VHIHEIGSIGNVGNVVKLYYVIRESSKNTCHWLCVLYSLPF